MEAFDSLSIKVIEADDCKIWTEKVHQQRVYWTSRHQSLPFFTLGLAAYLDASSAERRTEGTAPYNNLRLRSWNNNLLKKNFASLLDRCLDAMEDLTKLHAHFDCEHTALPGFHIHLPHSLFAGKVASKHIDLQFKRVFPRVQFSDKDVMTFTVPLSLPEGAGLKVWQGSTESLHRYELGTMLVHSGLQPHQAILFPSGGNTPRVMLQGHGVRINNQWLLYW